MNRICTGFLLLLFSFMPLLLLSQANIPLDSWRSHFSYRSANSLVLADERVYAASANGLFYFDRDDNSITVLSSLQGLSDAGISSLNFQEDKKILVVTYRNGNIDLIEKGRVFNIRAVLEANLPGRRKVNQVLLKDNFALLATDYGISLVDLISKGIVESYFNLGPAGEVSEVFNLAIWNDSLYAATEKGLIGNAWQGSNLSDYSNWRRYEMEGLPANGEIKTLAATSEGLFVGVGQQGLLKKEPDGWKEAGFSTDKKFRSIKAAKGGLLIALEDALYLYNTATKSFRKISSPLITSPREAAIDQQGKLWVADGVRGLLSDFEGAFKAYIPQGPLGDAAKELYADEERLIAVFEQLAGSEQQDVAVGGFSVFENGSWKNYTANDVPGMPDITDFSDVVLNPVNGKYYLSSFSKGLLEWNPATEKFKQFTAANKEVSLDSTLKGITPVSLVAADAQGQIWMVQPGTTTPLHRYDPLNGSWQGYLANNAKAGRAGELLILPNNDKWLQLPEAGGILVFNDQSGKSRYLTEQVNAGSLLKKEATTLALDLEGQLWVGLGEGINYFPAPQSVLNEPEINAAWPIYQRRHLLNAERVTSLEVDGGNRKWVGTTNGLWVVGDYGDTIYHSFTTANTPLPNNYILSQAIMQQTGEVFIATPSGIVSYRSGATAAGFQHTATIKVFPNPVDPAYNGKVGITGLASDVVVKITDISGRLIKEIASEGGTAVWDLTDSRGKRPPTGVYLIFSTTLDGVETLAGKMAVIN